MIKKFCYIPLSLLATAAIARSQTRSVLIPVTPCRAVDTRQAAGPLAGPDMLAGSSRSFAIATSSCGIPATASAYSLNVTVVPKGILGYLTVWPTGQTQPVVSTLNSANGQIIANAAIVAAGTSGAVSVFVSDETDVIIDIDGYFTLDQADTSTQSTAYGAGALANDTSPSGNNSAFGTSALTANSSGYANTASGAQALSANTTGAYNTASGSQALASNVNGIYNTATGSQAMSANISGNYNSAFGVYSISSATSGNYNSAFGYGAMAGSTGGTYNTISGAFSFGRNTTGTYNTASGFGVMAANSTGSYNTATGGSALYNNSSGSNNTASGYQALYGNNMTGSGNTASGYQALYSDTSGYLNTASGSGALYANGTGTYNTASGSAALGSNQTGSFNIASGWQALGNNISGSYNTSLGWAAGVNNSSGNYNVDIANQGSNTDSGVIRIGTSGQRTTTLISGITGIPVTGSAVIVSSSGQLGVAASSRKYKEEIQPLGDDTDNALMQLRPVSFRYKGTTPVQYGLIAEEVDQIIPSLVSRDSNGDPMSVQYHELPALLLSEIQRQRKMIDELEKRLAQLESGSPLE